MTILITGATSGIGEELARQLQGKGKLLLTGRNVEKLQLLKTSLKGEVATLFCDLSKDHEKILQWIEEEKPDLIFNNAGFGFYGPYEEMTEEEISQMIQVNCVVLSDITRTAIKIWKKEHIQGCVMNISSLASFVPMPLSALYGATKAFVTSLTISCDLEARPYGISILAACPGMVATEFSYRASKKVQKIPPFYKKLLVMGTAGAVKKILAQVEKRKRVEVIGFSNKFLYGLVRFLPAWVVGGVISSNLKNRL